MLRHEQKVNADSNVTLPIYIYVYAPEQVQKGIQVIDHLSLHTHTVTRKHTNTNIAS